MKLLAFIFEQPSYIENLSQFYTLCSQKLCFIRSKSCIRNAQIPYLKNPLLYFVLMLGSVNSEKKKQNSLR